MNEHLIDFNGISTRPRVFYAKSLLDYVPYMFSYFVQLIKRFFGRSSYLIQTIFNRYFFSIVWILSGTIP